MVCYYCVLIRFLYTLFSLVYGGWNGWNRAWHADSMIMGDTPRFFSYGCRHNY